MKTDIDTLLQANHLAGMLITGPGQHNPAMVYLTGGGHYGSADLIKKAGAEPVLFYNPMERDEAAKSGLPTKNLAEYKFNELLKAANGDFIKATAARYQLMLTDCGLTSGRIALYGRTEVGSAYALFSALQQAMPEIELVGELSTSVLMQARLTKDEQEIGRIRRMGKVTIEVVEKTADFISSHTTRDSTLVKSDGQPLTIGEVKRQVNLWLAEAGAENPEGTIFAIGRDAGVPHSSGTASDVLRLGQTIVYDIFPCEAGGGYYYDFTRTWCLGYATDEVQKLYEDVRQVYNQVTSELKAGALCKEYQARTCDLFEAQGHLTIRTDPQTQQGYVHSLSHGLGLNIHERPWSGMNATDDDRLYPGAVFTVEPGLYYPEKNMGVRLEDTWYIRPDGSPEKLVEYPMDLVIPVR